MKAIVCAVDYSDLLALTLPRMRRHFSRYLIVTTPSGSLTPAGDSRVFELAKIHDCEVLTTTLFTDDGAAFAKWRALEWALDQYGREGWMDLLDADVVWPNDVQMMEKTAPNGEQVLDVCSETHGGVRVRAGQLFSPLRRMLLDPTRGIPPEQDWDMLPVHRNVDEHAGYSQVFHCSDPVLGAPPWHDTNFTTAGAADSMFQGKWAPENKVRPPWHCLHIGEPGQNWYGRSTRRVDGSTPVDAEEKRRRVWQLWHNRHRALAEGKERFHYERIKPAE